MGKQYVVRLPQADLTELTELAGGGPGARVRKWASVLLAAHEGLSDEQIAARVGVSVATAQRTRRRYAQAGLGAALGRPAAACGAAERASQAVTSCLELEGAEAAAVVDRQSGACLCRGGGGPHLGAAAAGAAEAVRAKLRTLAEMSLADCIEDIVATTARHYHLVRLVPSHSYFLYVILNRRTANLALARLRLEQVRDDLTD